MKNFHLLLVLVIAFLSISSTLIAQAQDNNTYRYNIDLQNVEDDQVKVRLFPPSISSKKATFIVPAVIPGSYTKKDYGRFIKDFKAIDKRGKSLKVKVKGVNNFYIKKAHKLVEINYRVDDTWDDTNHKQWVFQPGGTNIEAGKNFVINHHGFFGYFETKKMLPFELTFKKPQGMFAATSLRSESADPTTSILYSNNYVELVDNPAMFCEPDTTSFMANNTKVRFSVYSPNNIVTAKSIAAICKPLGDALSSFFGVLPVDHYDFILYFAGRDQNVFVDENAMAGFGALEHSYCSFYYLPEVPNEEFLKPLIQDVAAHEFLHILTPLNIHSEQIEDFDFRNPEMSEHLWLYEGVTEYFANLIQVRSGIITQDEFISKMEDKINRASEFDAISFTKMSKNILDPDLKDDYLNVYQKGALIGFGLDLILSKKSNGTYGLRELMTDLTKKYGPNKPFEDAALIDEIVEMTYPEVRDYFNTSVIGSKAVNYKQLFANIGWDFIDEKTEEAFGFGGFSLGFDPDTKSLFFTEVMPNTLGIENGDILKKIDGQTLSMANVSDLVGERLVDIKESKEVVLSIVRGEEEMELKGEPVISERTITNKISPMENPTEEQLKLRSFILGPEN